MKKITAYVLSLALVAGHGTYAMEQPDEEKPGKLPRHKAVRRLSELKDWKENPQLPQLRGSSGEEEKDEPITALLTEHSTNEEVELFFATLRTQLTRVKKGVALSDREHKVRTRSGPPGPFSRSQSQEEQNSSSQ